ncbi:MAG TPA: YbaY family lipoprotein [Caulifigura sp.]|nr:YbaY family lipoprotein [Caulifigura sp.]
MTLKTCCSLLAAAAASMLIASPARAVDPNLGTGISNPYGVAPYSYGAGTSTVPIARDRYGNIISGAPVDGIQSLSYPTRIAMPDYSVNGNVPVSPISSIGSDLRLNPNPGGLYPPTSSQQPRWKLGVYSKDTDTGVRIIQVVNGSAANRAGLEANDTIISVGGYQVGYVNGQLYDCATEFERSANEQGWVSMLVQDSRSGRLRNLPVQLESRYSRLTGSIVLNGYQQLPPGSYAVVELQEILRPGMPPVVLNQCRVDNPAGYQIPFTINFDPQQVDTRRSYVLTGRVMASNQTVYAPRNTVQVLAPNTPQNVQLAFDRVSGGGVIGPYAQDAQLAQILALYEQYLNRQPTYQERTVWESDLSRGLSLNDVKANIFGQNQFFNACDRDERIYINRLHEINLGRPAKNEELAYWMDVYNQRNGVRSLVAQDFLNAIAGQPSGQPR